MHRRLLVSLVAVFAVSLAGGCDKGEAKKADAKKADAKKADAKKTDDKSDDKPEAAGPSDDKPLEAKHFDIEADKSGALARTASVLESTDVTSEDTALREHLAGLSHHADQISSDQTLCKHIMELRKAADQPEGAMESCVIHFEHEIVILGPEVFSQMAQCVMDAKTAAEIDVCEAAEKEAEQLLHEKHHGEGLSEEVCKGLFDKFEELSMVDAGDHSEDIKAVLEEVRADSVQACVDQGTQAEVDCAMKAANMDVLTECQEHI